MSKKKKVEYVYYEAKGWELFFQVFGIITFFITVVIVGFFLVGFAANSVENWWECDDAPAYVSDDDDYPVDPVVNYSHTYVHYDTSWDSVWWNCVDRYVNTVTHMKFKTEGKRTAYYYDHINKVCPR